MKISKVNIIEVWGFDKLYPILEDAYKVIFISFQALYLGKQKEPYTKPTNSKKWFLEDLITDDLIVEEHTFDKAFNYTLIPQAKNIEKKTKIDIAIHYSTQIGRNYYLEIECKLLHSKNLNYYIDGGIRKFKTNKYSEKLPIAGMLAFNTKGNILENIKLLNTKISNKISAKEMLDKIIMPDICTHTYKSNHQRVLNSNIDIYTMALDFEEVIYY